MFEGAGQSFSTVIREKQKSMEKTKSFFRCNPSNVVSRNESMVIFDHQFRHERANGGVRKPETEQFFSEYLMSWSIFLFLSGVRGKNFYSSYVRFFFFLRYFKQYNTSTPGAKISQYINPLPLNHSKN